MNYLAHLHLAHLANSSLLGNLMADYVRGDPRHQWPTRIADGINLHRRIDALTDALPQVRLARQLFRSETRRVAPITLDVIWDHFLTHHWNKLVPDISLPAFLAHARNEIEPDLSTTPPRFQTLNAWLWRERWIERYADPAFLSVVLQGMASRRPKLSALTGSYQDFTDNYQQLEDLFWQLYPPLMVQAARCEL
ncbi:ACP phosphodiesterase [Erwinia amylovora]|uniref:Acyl carrier protein phosphodiesterase n=4 Tax=Erwinia amylovora TaxID=552 RepID=A0A830ZZW0_ERWAM|nr:ACP phosphodiesterase [Erwinia amylovora]CBX79794.1 Acyl carrier protein phosphodiesterase [Erwinia amylovora ATCC BAA-2158]CCP02318.1 Acyl carrier protein phosphodiesterase [Erwinia amylovora Ea644]CDK14511.1 Acyl carrier protein phosphodiesterase [Erwinia amylovora LA635]CDK17878.1 Acyl carrier protein phosphodiesterase [Erwinia amylovora LA636]CDK21247.1 Acyl carrier protein phosphodiesterase [Erwinia amylovora LA637]